MEIVPMGLRHVIQFVLGATQATGGDGMQQRFPDMSAAAVDQRNAGAAGCAKAFAELGRQLRPAAPPPTMTM